MIRGGRECIWNTNAQFWEKDLDLRFCRNTVYLNNCFVGKNDDLSVQTLQPALPSHLPTAPDRSWYLYVLPHVIFHTTVALLICKVTFLTDCLTYGFHYFQTFLVLSSGIGEKYGGDDRLEGVSLVYQAIKNRIIFDITRFILPFLYAVGHRIIPVEFRIDLCPSYRTSYSV